jgi:hypothetical protein
MKLGQIIITVNIYRQFHSIRMQLQNFGKYTEARSNYNHHQHLYVILGNKLALLATIM